MSRASRWSLVLLCVGLGVFGLLQPDPRRQFSVTTFGTVPAGFGALFETLATLGVPVTRSYVPPDDVPAGSTVWWIEPEDMCAATAMGPLTQEAALAAWGGHDWVAAGGTAIVFPPRAAACALVAGVALPARTLPSGGDDDAEQRQHGGDAPPVAQVVRGPLTARPRRLDVAALATFADDGGMRVVARIDDRPFVLEQPVGAGRLIAVADARFLQNRWLDGGDAAVLALDLVRAYGAPRFDERMHGLRRETHPLRYVMRSNALPVLIGLLLLGGLFVWGGNLVPARTLTDAAIGAPTLSTFVDSMAQLYAGTGDYGSVLERYRALSAARLRRHFHLPPETPVGVLIDRLRAARRGSDAELAWLTSAASAAAPADLDRAVRGLDALVRKVTR